MSVPVAPPDVQLPARPSATAGDARRPRLPGWVAAIAPFLMLIAVWHLIVVGFGISSIVMPGPYAVARDLASNPEAYGPDLLLTLRLAATGLLAGMGLGIALAIVSWFSPTISGLVTPATVVVQSVPVVALAPVVLRIFGYGGTSVVAVTIMISVFPAFVFTSAGLRSVSKSAEDLMTVLGASRLVRLVRVNLPAALPDILVALRISAAYCVLGALVAEYLMGTEGLGYLLASSRENLMSARTWGVAVVATVPSVVAFLGASRLERWGKERMT